MRKKAKLVFGVGVNDADYEVQAFENKKSIWICPFYRAWKEMMRRCYSKNYQEKQPTYHGCTVAIEWHLFSCFRVWMSAQDWEGKQLDKDILITGNKVYSPGSCVFVSAALNAFLTDSAASRGCCPIGVSWHKRDQKYAAYCSNPFTRRLESLGYYKDSAEAHHAWRKRKQELALEYAAKQVDKRIADALINRYAEVI